MTGMESSKLATALIFAWQIACGSLSFAENKALASFPEGRERELVTAIVSGEKDKFKGLLEGGSNPNFQSSLGVSPVYYAACDQDSWYLEKILEFGGDPNLVNPQSKNTPIFESIKRFRVDNIKLLLKHGAKTEVRGWLGYTPLTSAASINQYDQVLILLEAGADPEFPTEDGATLDYFMKNHRMDPQSKNYQDYLKVKNFLRQVRTSLSDYRLRRG